MDPIELELDAQIQFKDSISTKEIQQLLIMTAAEKVSPHTPQWQYVAARLLLYDLYKEGGHLRGYKVKDKLNGYKPLYPDITDNPMKWIDQFIKAVWVLRLVFAV